MLKISLEDCIRGSSCFTRSFKPVQIREISSLPGMGMQSLLADPLSSLGPVFCHMQDRQERGGGEGEADPNCSQNQKRMRITGTN